MLDFYLLIPENREHFFFFSNVSIGCIEVLRNLFGRQKEVLELLVKDRLKIDDGDLIPASPTNVLW